jgi:carboxymethylenebutenolidase
MTSHVSFEGAGDKSGRVSGELAEPGGAGKVPCVVLIQEYWGLNAHIKDLVDRMAKEGFLVVAPDLYHGKVTTDPAEAAKLATALDTIAAVGDVAGAVAFLRSHLRSNGKVGVMGFCLGGAISLAAACHVEGLGAVSAFYGIPPANKVDYAKATAPIITHVAKHDEWVSVARMEGVKKDLESAGSPSSMEMYVYDAKHAFANDSRPEVYDAASAKLAWDRTVAFFKKHLA